MNDRNLEDTRMPEDEVEEFECYLCEGFYILDCEHITLTFNVRRGSKTVKTEKDICVYCSDKIDEIRKDHNPT